MEERELVERLTKLESKTKENTSDIREVKETAKEIRDINVTMNGILIEMKHMREDSNKANAEMRNDINSVKDDVTKINEDVGNINKEIVDIKTKPQAEKAKTFDKVKWEVGKWILLAIVAYLFGVMFPLIK